MTIVEIGAGTAVITIRQFSENCLHNRPHTPTTLIRINPFDQDSRIVLRNCPSLEVINEHNVDKATALSEKCLIEIRLGAKEGME